MSKPQYVVGIDLGTYSSGICGCPVDPMNDDPAQRRFHFYDQWPGQPVPSMKNLSALLVSPDGEVLAWGYQARERALSQPSTPDSPQYRAGFKMQLMDPAADSGDSDATGPLETEDDTGQDDSEPAPDDELPDAAAEKTSVLDIPERPSWTEESPLSQAEFLTVELLKRLRQRALEQVTSSGYLEEDVRWCITVPAIFGDRARQRIRRLAVAAGFPAEDGRLVLALEPEAAAHSARHRRVRVPGEDVSDASDLTEPGRQIVILDCGGGTVDMAAYQNDEDGNLVEIGLVNGAALGSNELNQRFEDRLLADRFGKPEFVERLKEEAPEAMLLIGQAWERGKLSFGPDTVDGLTIPLPTAVDRKLGATVRKRLARKQRGNTEAIVVTANEVRELFDTVVPEILDLVDEQMTEVAERDNGGHIPVVLMVGGFSSSPYLQHAVKEHLEGRAKVLVPPDPSSAVLYGAAHFAYAPQTRARRARFTYGVHTASNFEPGVDPEELRLVTSKGKEKCTGRFAKLVTRGDIIDTGQDAAHWFTPLEGKQEEVSFELFTSTEENPRYVTDPGCRYLGIITADLGDVMDLAREDRKVDVSLNFGETEIKARAVVRQSGKEAACALDFDSDY